MTAAQFAAWLTLNLVPFSVIGIALVIAGMYYDRISTPTSRRIFCALFALLAACVYISAAEVYDQCSDPSYINTWWWYVWGCYLR